MYLLYKDFCSSKSNFHHCTTGPLPLKKVKMDDLMSLLAYIPPHYHEFYKALQVTSSPPIYIYTSDDTSGDECLTSDSEESCNSDGED